MAVVLVAYADLPPSFEATRHALARVRAALGDTRGAAATADRLPARPNGH